MNEVITFGEMLQIKRKSRGLSLREVSHSCGITPAYYCDIERGARNPPQPQLLEKIIDVLYFSKEERRELIRLAYLERKQISTELVEYMCLEAPCALRLIELAKELNLSNNYFEKLINVLEKDM